MSKSKILDDFLESAKMRFGMYRKLGHAALNQLSLEDMKWQPHEDFNSIAVIVKHLHGNMESRWVDFLTTDGESPDRDRDGEFKGIDSLSRENLLNLWDEGWSFLENAVHALTVEDLAKTVEIRREPLTVVDAVHRQLGHVAYHVGQIVSIGKERLGKDWKTLSIPKGQSKNVDLIRSMGFGYSESNDRHA